MSVIICKQCGEAKAEAKFRPYSHRGGYNKVCRVCENINSRYRYLLSKGDDATMKEHAEMEKINTLFELLRQRNLKIPVFGEGRAPSQTSEAVEALLARNQIVVETMVRVEGPAPQAPEEIPDELQFWLDTDLSGEDPDALYDKYDELREEYLATHKAILEKILTRFDEYDDAFER